MTDEKRVIINADDFGLSSSVNEAVERAHREGILTSATVMANMPGFEEAVRIAKASPRLGVGVHLNLLRGAPVSDPTRVQTLVDRRGKFLESAATLWERFLLRRIDVDEVEVELSAQVARVAGAGISPTHIDSEKHLHVLIPRLGEIACRVAVRSGICAVRVVREPVNSLRGMPRPKASQVLAALLLNRQGAALARRARKADLACTDRFFGVALTGRMTSAVYEALFSNPAAGSLEIMCHPAISPEASRGVRSPSWLDRYRPDEYRALLDPMTRECISKSGYKLISYGELR